MANDSNSIQTMVLQQLSDTARAKLGTTSGLRHDQTNQVVESAITTILAGLQQNAAKPAGASKLNAALAKDHDGSILNDVDGAVGSQHTSRDGTKILNHIFGSKTDDVAKTVATHNGVPKAASANILSVLAPLVLGQLGALKKTKGLDTTGVADTLLRQKLPNNQVVSIATGLLDRNHDGNIVDDVFDIGKSFFKKK